MRRRRRRAGLRSSDLEHRDPDPGVGARGERFAQPRPVAVVLEVERHRSHALLLGEEVEEVGRLEHRRVAARDHGVEAQAAVDRDRVDGLVAALRHDRHAAVPRAADSASPHSATRRGYDTIPFPFGPHTGSSWRRAALDQLALELLTAFDLGEPGAVHDAPPLPSRPASSITAGTDAAGTETTTASGTPGRSPSDGKHSNP